MLKIFSKITNFTFKVSFFYKWFSLCFISFYFCVLLSNHVWSQDNDNPLDIPVDGLNISSSLTIDNSQVLILILVLLLTLLLFLIVSIWRITDLKNNSKYTRSEAFVYSFPLLIQGTTIFLIVISSVLIALLDSETTQSVLSLLAAVAGYVLGRASKEDKESMGKKGVEKKFDNQKTQELGEDG